VVNLAVSYIPRSGTITALEDTIDYADLFAIIDQAMKDPVDLLETLAQHIAAEIHRKYPQVTETDIEIEKLNPPIDKFTGSAAVRFRRRDTDAV